MDKTKDAAPLLPVELIFAAAGAEIAELASRIDRYSEIVTGSPMTSEEQVVFDMLGDD